MPSFIEPIRAAGAEQHVLRVERTGAVLAHRLLAALDRKSRKTGLLRHDSLPPGTAMIIAPTNAVHTFGMRFDIDIVFVTRNGRVLKVRHAVPRRRMTAAWRAFAVIELPAGAAAAADVRADDRLLVTSAG